MMPKFKVLIFLRRTMLWLNFFAILFNATLFIYATNYVIKTSQSYQFLESLHHIPDSPQTIFWESIVSFSVLAIVMSFHHYYYAFKQVVGDCWYSASSLFIIIITPLSRTQN